MWLRLAHLVTAPWENPHGIAQTPCTLIRLSPTQATGISVVPDGGTGEQAAPVGHSGPDCRDLDSNGDGSFGGERPTAGQSQASKLLNPQPGGAALGLTSRPAQPTAPASPLSQSKPAPTPTLTPEVKPTYVITRQPYALPAGSVTPDQQTNPVYGYRPAQLEGAYDLNNIYFGGINGNGGIKGTGAGQTVAIVDWGDNPAFLQTSDPNWANPSLNSLYYFDQYWGLPNTGFTFTKYDQNGNVGGVGINLGTGIEIALDVEAVHLAAPQANIDLVEASSTSIPVLYKAVETAATLPGVSVVSMSFGADLEYFGEGYLEQQLDSEFLEPALAANPNVTFLAATGDNGASRNSLLYPSASPLVVGVGGTSVYLNSQDQWETEYGWSGSGGGISNTYTEPVWQEPFQSTGYRTLPDVSADAGVGLTVYDPFDFGASSPWDEVGGTSLATQLWAGMLAIANQGLRAGRPGGARRSDERNADDPLDAGLPVWFGRHPLLYAADYHDITFGYNGYSAKPGYDFVTGIGSPESPTLLPNLAAYGTATELAFATAPPASVIPGADFGVIVEATGAMGTPDVSQNGTVELSGTDGSSYYSTMTAGLAVFNDISLASLGTYDYTASFLTSSLTPGTSTNVTVNTPAPGVDYYFPMPIYGTPDGPGDLYDAVSAANLAGGTNIIELSQSKIPYDVSEGELYVWNASSNPVYSLLIYGDTAIAANSVLSASYANRVLEIAGDATTWVYLNNLTIVQGYANNTGAYGSTGTAWGGGLLIDGGNVSLTGAVVSNNEAVGSNGRAGAFGVSAHATHPTGGAGEPGGNGDPACGGGVYQGGGTLTLNAGTVITGNLAQGGAGGHGGTGGSGSGYGTGKVHYTTHTRSGKTVSTSFTTYHRTFFSGNGGPGGTGGAGGAAEGGGIYAGGGQLSITDSVFDSNNAIGGAGGSGGAGGFAADFGQEHGGNGGSGGPAGSGGGGGVFIASGNNVPFVHDDIKNNLALGGAGGAGGEGRIGGFGRDGHSGGFASGTTGHGKGNPGAAGGSGSAAGPGGNGGPGGTGGNGGGGGIYVSYGSFSISGGYLWANTAEGGAGGAGGMAGRARRAATAGREALERPASRALTLRAATAGWAARAATAAPAVRAALRAMLALAVSAVRARAAASSSAVPVPWGRATVRSTSATTPRSAVMAARAALVALPASAARAALAAMAVTAATAALGAYSVPMAAAAGWAARAATVARPGPGHPATQAVPAVPVVPGWAVAPMCLTAP